MFVPATKGSHNRGLDGMDVVEPAVQIAEFETRYANDFRRLNLEWLHKFFVVEAIDEMVLDHPEAIVANGGQIFFALIPMDGCLAPVGTCAVMSTALGYELTKMAVTEAQQGQGIGKRLLDHVLAWAKNKQIEKLYLVTNSGLLSAVSLYRKAGFQITRRGQNGAYQRGDLEMEIRL